MMVRTQIYLTAEEQAKLRTLSRRLGRKQSELIREAVDQYLEQQTAEVRLSRLRACKGIWKDRDASELKTIREEIERRLG